MFTVVSSLARSGQRSGNKVILPVTANLKFLVTCHFSELTTSGKVHQSRIKLTRKPDPSVVSFSPGLALMKTTVLESMRKLSYFRLDTLTLVSSLQASPTARVTSSIFVILNLFALI